MRVNVDAQAPVPLLVRLVLQLLWVVPATGASGIGLWFGVGRAVLLQHGGVFGAGR